MNDPIDRQAATQTALEFIVEYLGGAFDEDFQRKLIERMNALSPAQPDLQQTCNKLATDCISRHAVSAWLDNIGHPKFADVVMDEKRFPPTQSDFDITVKIDKAYDDGYEEGYLQGRHDWGDLDE